MPRNAVRNGKMCWQLFAHIIVRCGLPNAAYSHKSRFYSPNCSNYVIKCAAACLHFTSQTEPCTVGVMIIPVPLLSYIYIYIYTLPVCPQNARGSPAFAVSCIVMAKQQLMQVKSSTVFDFCVSCFRLIT